MLEVKNLTVSFHTYAGEVQALRGVDFVVEDGEVLAIVGESGCGKSVTVQSVMQLHKPDTVDYKAGEILYNGENLLQYTEKQMQQVRGKEISMIFQDVMTSLNPTMTVGKQITEILKIHGQKDAGKNKEQAIELLRAVGIANPEKRYDQYPHEFSGGMRQRVMIAIASACNPKILIADEPTTALDVTVQAQILDLMKELQKERNMSIIFITHNLGVVANIAQKVAVMYGGIVVESGTVYDIFYRSKHPYTWGLMNSTFRLEQDKKEELHPIEGTPPDLLNPPKGCLFASRCEYAMKICTEQLPEQTELGTFHKCRCHLLDPDCPVDIDEVREHEQKFS